VGRIGSCALAHAEHEFADGGIRLSDEIFNHRVK
jgi:hypothetical protein